MIEIKHTPGELKSNECWTDESVLLFPDTASEPGGMIAEVYGEDMAHAKANAARLVLCWNTHDQLVEALTNLVSEADRIGEYLSKNGLGSTVLGMRSLAAKRALSAANGEDKSNG